MKKEEKNKIMTPNRTIRNFCFNCVGKSSWNDVDKCEGVIKNGLEICPFHNYRLGKGRPSVKIFKKFCLQCMGNNREFVKLCDTTNCLIYPYRMGTNPNYSSDLIKNTL